MSLALCAVGGYNVATGESDGTVVCVVGSVVALAVVFALCICASLCAFNYSARQSGGGGGGRSSRKSSKVAPEENADDLQQLLADGTLLKALDTARDSVAVAESDLDAARSGACGACRSRSEATALRKAWETFLKARQRHDKAAAQLREIEMDEED